MSADAEAGRGAVGKASKAALIAAFATIYLVWGSTYLGIRVAVETLPSFLMAGIRFAVAGVLVLGALLARGRPWPTARQWRDQAIAGTFMLLGGNAVVSWAEQRTPSGITCLILGAGPLIVVAFDWIRPGGGRPTASTAIGVLVGIAGIVLLLGPGAIPPGWKPPAVCLAALFASSLCWWTGSFYSKHSTDKPDPLMASAMQMVCGSICILLVSMALGEWSTFHPSEVTGRSWAAFAYLVTVGSIVVFPVYVWLLGHSTPAKVSTFAYVNPVIAMFLGWLILGEPLNARIIVAAAIITGAVAVITVAKTRAPAPKGASG
jgi:drug/metabolite transporter (DMT)-like permease